MAESDRPLRADARRNQQRLLQAAREAFTDNGEAASLDDIAKRAGVGPGTLYRHFPTREALLAEVYRDGCATLASQADELGKTMEALPALTAFLRLQMDYAREKRGLGVALKAMFASDSELFEWTRKTLRDALGGLLLRTQEEGLIRTDIDPPALLRLVHGVALASETAPGEADHLLAIVVDGLRVR